ncbi:MAG: universal stress protein [Bacteroidota bacterium]
MKKIIVPVDFSEESMNGLDLAIKVANHMKASVEMVHVIKESNEFFLAAEKEHRKHAEKSFKKVMEEFQDQVKEGNELTYVIHKGRIHHEIVNHAKYNSADMIIGSTHGASGFEEFFIGSNAHRIIASSQIPTMFIRHGVAPRTFNRILLPIDDTIETRQKVPFTTELAQRFDAEIIIQSISLTDDPQITNRVRAYTDQVIEYMEKENVKYQLSEAQGDIVKNILESARKYDVDLIASMAEEERTLSSFDLGGNVMELLRKANVPLLCIHQQKYFHKYDIFRTPSST